MPHRRNSRPSNVASRGGRSGGTATLPAGAPFKMRAATSAALRLSIANGHQPSADDPMAEQWAEPSEQGAFALA